MLTSGSATPIAGGSAPETCWGPCLLQTFLVQSPCHALVTLWLCADPWLLSLWQTVAIASLLCFPEQLYFFFFPAVAAVSLNHSLSFLECVNELWLVHACTSKAGHSVGAQKNICWMVNEWMKGIMVSSTLKARNDIKAHLVSSLFQI